MTLSEMNFIIEAQHDKLRTVLLVEPVLASLQFQGKNLSELATPAGLQAFKFAARRNDFDRISLNHGIKRLSLEGREKEIIWHHHGSMLDYIDSDTTTSTLERHSKDIIDEILGALNTTSKFPDSDSLTNRDGLWSWGTFFDKSGSPNRKLHSMCPKTSELIDTLTPNLTFGFVFVSVLAPNTTIAAHRGSTSLRQRYHLGVKIPNEGVSRIRIGGSWRTWARGKAFGFNDALEHAVEHLSQEERVVFIIDLWPSCLSKDLVSAIKRNPCILELGVMSRESGPIALND